MNRRCNKHYKNIFVPIKSDRKSIFAKRIKNRAIFCGIILSKCFTQSLLIQIILFTKFRRVIELHHKSFAYVKLHQLSTKFINCLLVQQEVGKCLETLEVFLVKDRLSD